MISCIFDMFVWTGSKDEFNPIGRMRKVVELVPGLREEERQVIRKIIARDCVPPAFSSNDRACRQGLKHADCLSPEVVQHLFGIIDTKVSGLYKCDLDAAHAATMER